MLFAPARLGNTTLGREELAADRKSCKRFGPCGVGEKALYLNSFFIDRRYYVALSSVRRVFKRVAMSKGGFSGKGVFGSIPYLVVEYDGGQVKQCTFKHEDDVDRMIECIARYLPDIPLHSEKVERHLAEQKAEKAQRYVRNLTADAETTRAQLEQAMALLEENYADETAELSRAAKAKRVNDRTNPAYKWVALAIVIAGAAAMVYGIITLIRGGGSLGIYFALFGFAAVFLFSGAHVLPTAKNNRGAVTRAWEQAEQALADKLPADFPVPARYAHPIVLRRMIRILREGRAQTAPEALEVLKADLKALNASVQVEQAEYDEVVAIKPMFLLHEYK